MCGGVAPGLDLTDLVRQVVQRNVPGAGHMPLLPFGEPPRIDHEQFGVGVERLGQLLEVGALHRPAVFV